MNELTAEEIKVAAKVKFDRLANAFRDLHKLTQRIVEPTGGQYHILQELHINTLPDVSNCVRVHAFRVGGLEYFSSKITTDAYALLQSGAISTKELNEGFGNKEWQHVLDEAIAALASTVVNDGIPNPTVYVAEIRDVSNVVGMTRLESLPTIWNTCVLSHDTPFPFMEMFT